MAKLKVEVIVGLIDKLTKPLATLSGKLDKISAVASRSGAVLAAAGGGMGASLAPAISAFATTEDAATRMDLAFMKAGGTLPPVLQKINKLTQDLGDKLPGSTKDFQDMVRELSRQGLSMETILGGTGKAAANLAVLLEMPPTGAAEFTAKLQDATRTASKDMLQLADVINRSFYSGVDPENMLGAFSTIAPAMDTIKLKGIEGAKALGPLITMLDQAGLTGTKAGNALRKVFQRSFGASEKARAAIASADLEFVGADGEFLGLDNLFKQLKKLEAFSTEKRLNILQSIWGDDAETLQALTTMISKGQAGYDATRRAMEGQASLGERMERLLGTLKNLWEATTGTFQNLLADVGGLLAPELKKIAGQMNAVIVKARQWIQENPELAKTIAKVAGITATALTAIGGATLALGTFSWAASAALGPLRGLIGGIGAIGTALRAVSAVLLTTPIGLLGVALAGAAALVYKYWSPIKGFFVGFWDGLTSGLGDVSASFQSAFAPIMPIIQPVIDGVGWLVDKIGDILQPVEAAGGAAEDMGRRFGSVAAQILAMPAKIIAEFMRIPARLSAITAQLVQVGSDWVAGLWRGMQAKWAEFTSWVTNKVNSIAGIFRKETKTQSPSRVFADIGNDLMAGLQLGLDQRSARVLGQVGKLAGALAAVPLALSPVAAQDMTGAVAAAQQTLSSFPTKAISGVSATLPPALAAPALATGGVGLPSHQIAPALSAAPPARLAVTAPGVGAASRAAPKFEIHITNHITAPAGSDEQRLVDLLDRRMSDVSGRLVRKLSSFYDDEDDV